MALIWGSSLMSLGATIWLTGGAHYDTFGKTKRLTERRRRRVGEANVVRGTGVEVEVEL